MMFDVFPQVVTLFKTKRKETLTLFGVVALFLIILTFFQSMYLAHVQSIVLTLGSYILALTDVIATNEEPLIGFSIVSYILKDIIVKQALVKFGIAYAGLLLSLFVVWNLGMFVVTKKTFALLKRKQLFSLREFTTRNAKWLGIFLIYNLIYFLFNLKFSLLDSVVIGSSWQQSALALINTLVRFTFLFFIIRSYTQKRFFTLPNLLQLSIFILAIVTVFVFDKLTGFLTSYSSLIYILGFILLVLFASYFLTAFFSIAKDTKQTTSVGVSKKLVWSHIVIACILLIVAIPFSSFFLLTGIEETGVLSEKPDLRTASEVADLLRTSEDELLVLYQSGIKVLVLEFSDFDCPYCRGAQSYVDELHELDSVFVYRRHFPVTSIHPQSYSAAVAYECLKADGFAQEARSYLYGTQGEHSRNKYVSFAESMNISSTTFESCLDSQEIKNLVEHDISTARSLGMSATPTFYVIPLDSVSNYMQVDGADKDKINTFIAQWS